ncbi:uncharacterized protein [Nicotiana tomentosiformis]|uniref:uncharacterized protein n=1 Tax=Nicotiana tomentosiformis TaxID=4098 RepID=UPI00388CE61F
MEADKIDHMHPLFVHPSDTPSSILIPVKLTELKNYGLWRRSMRIALQAKRKLGFMSGTCKKDSFKSELHVDWETCNAIVLSWIMKTVSPDLLSGIRVTISYGTDFVSAYFTELKELWIEYDAMVPIPNSKKYAEHLQQQSLMQFLSRLNETYDQARRQILMKTIEPTLNQGYALIIEDESQNSNSTVGNRGYLIAMQADNIVTGGSENDKSIQEEEGKSSNDGLKSGPYFTKDQYRQILSMLNRETPGCQANMADALEAKDKVSAYSNEQVHLPIGGKPNVSHIGKPVILDKEELDNVLFVPEFKFNLLPDLYNGKVRGIGREKGGMYILKKGFIGDLDKLIRGIKQFASTTTTKNNEEDGALWHRRLGHA